MPRLRDHEEDLEDDEMNENELEEEGGPPSIDPYAVLELDTDATADHVKKAYRKLALKHHPDKAPEADKTAANKKFQEIAFAYAVLSDEARRKRYDLTGSTAESIEGDDDFDWLSFYRQQFDDVVTQDNINRIADEYKNSADERRDLLDAYTKKKGNLDAIYGLVMLSDVLEDDDRFRKILDEEIEKGTIDSFKTYEKQNTDAARKKAKDKEIKRREQFDKEHGNDFEDAKAKAKSRSKPKKNDVSNMAGLAALIQRKQATRGNFFDQLEAKYAPNPRGKKRATPMEEPPEEMFEAARKKHKENGARKKAAKKAEDDDDMEDDEEDIVPSEEDEESEEEKPVPKKKGRLTKGKGRAKARPVGDQPTSSLASDTLQGSSEQRVNSGAASISANNAPAAGPPRLPSPESSTAMSYYNASRATLAATTRNVSLAAGTGPLERGQPLAPVQGPQLAPLMGLQTGVSPDQGRLATLEPSARASGPGDTVRGVLRRGRGEHGDTDEEEEGLEDDGDDDDDE